MKQTIKIYLRNIAYYTHLSMNNFKAKDEKTWHMIFRKTDRECINLDMSDMK